MASYRDRLDDYEHRVQMSTWMGASLAGFISLIALNAIPESANFLKPYVLTLIGVAAVSAAYTRVGFEWEAIQLKKVITDEKAELSPEHKEWPTLTELRWRIFLCSYHLAGIILLISIWSHPTIQIASNINLQGAPTSPTIEVLDRKLSDRISELSCQLKILEGAQSRVTKSEAVERQLVVVESMHQEMERVFDRIEHLNIKINNLSDIFCKCGACK